MVVKEPIVDVSKWPFFVFLMSAIICLSSSATFHLCGSLSPKTHSFLAKLDYASISILIAGSCYPPVYYAFFYESKWAILYLTNITLLSFIVLLVSLHSKFATPRYRPVKGVLYITLGLLAGLPVLHVFIYKNEFFNPSCYFAVMGFCYIFGACIYMLRFPEKYFPGTFDYFGSSH